MSAKSWFPICVFDEVPNWSRLGQLHPDAYICGFEHRSGKYWYALAGVSDLPPLFQHFEESYAWPIDYELSESLPIPPEYSEFLEKVGTVGRAAQMQAPGYLHYGVAASLLAGVRTYVFAGESKDDAMNLACVLNNGTVEGFGMAQGMTELWWDHGTVGVHLALGPSFPDPDSSQENFNRLRALPFVKLEVSHDDPSLPRYWPQTIWPEAWEDPGGLMGIGLEAPTYEWARNWRDCYWKPPPNQRGAWAWWMERWLGRPFECTWLGRRILGDWNKKLYDDEA